MKIRQYGENLWVLTRLAAFNSFLVREDDGLTVVDTNMGDVADDILQTAQDIGLPVTRVTLTHAHIDHIGALDPLAAQLPDADIAFTERTAQFLRGDVHLLPDEPQAEIRGGFAVRTTTPTRLLQPGDKVGSLRVVATPGHSPDHIAFFDERDGTLIAGDALQTQGGVAVSGVRRLLFPLPAMASWHLPTALESARILRQLNPKRLAVGHGRVLENPLQRMDEAIVVAEKVVNGQTAA